MRFCQGTLRIIWGLWCEKQVPQAEISNSILQYAWDEVIYPCPWYLLLAPKSTYQFEFRLNGTLTCYSRSLGCIVVTSVSNWKQQDGIYCHGANSVVAGVTAVCRYGNLWCRTWRQSWYDENSSLTSYKTPITTFLQFKMVFNVLTIYEKKIMTIFAIVNHLPAMDIWLLTGIFFF